MRGEIATLFDNLAQDDGVRAVVLTSADGHFCSGADTDEMGAADSAAFLKRMRALHRMIRAIMPFFIVELMVLLIITFVPGIVTFLPELFGF